MRFSYDAGLVGCIALVLVSTLFVIPHAHSVAEITLDPSGNTFYTTSSRLGSKFNVTAWVGNVSDLFAYQVRVYYDRTMINATRAWLPTWSPQWVFYGKTSTRLTPVLEANYTEVGDVIYGDPTFTGAGQLAIFEFQIIKSPSVMGALSCSLGVDNADTYLIDSSGANEIPALKINGFYKYVWSPPPKPHLAVDPAFVEQSNLMSVFDIGIFIMSLDAGWELTNATMSLVFNSTVIDILGGAANITIAPGWTGPNSISIDQSGAEMVNLTVRNPANASGNLQVATLRFTVMDHGTTELVFSSSWLADQVMQIPTDSSVNGFIDALVVDVAITDVNSSKTIIGQGLLVPITVAVENIGDVSATFNVTAFANDLVIQTLTISLSSWNVTVINFSWNTTGFAKGNYTLSAQASPVPGDINATNNLHKDNWVIVAMIGDVTGNNGFPDGKVDIRDLAWIAKSYGSSIGQLRYVTNYDLNSDGKIDIKDLAVAARNFGKTDP